MIAKKLQLDNVEIARPAPIAKQRPQLAHTQNREIDYPPAGFGSRAIAIFIDGFLGQVFTAFMMSVVQFVDPVLVSPEDPILFLGVTVLVTCSSLFFTVCVPMMFLQQSPGKKLMGLRVVSLAPGGELTVGQIVKREMWSKGISAMLLGIGYLMALWDKDKRAWHDKNAMTRVVSIR